MCDMDIGEALGLYHALTWIHDEQVKSMVRNLLVKPVVVSPANDARTSKHKYQYVINVCADPQPENLEYNREDDNCLFDDTHVRMNPTIVMRKRILCARRRKQLILLITIQVIRGLSTIMLQNQKVPPTSLLTVPSALRQRGIKYDHL